MTDLSLFTEQIDFDAEEPDIVTEYDDNTLQHVSPVVSYEEIMRDFGT